MRGLRLGIVGPEAKKFTLAIEALARLAIKTLISKYQPTTVVSGKCPLGGIDIWSIEEALKARENGLTPHTVIGVEHPPEAHEWNPPGKIGYKQRNVSIAQDSDVVACIVLPFGMLPENFTGIWFEKCYHHGKEPGDHIKSGGCWTMARAKHMGKGTELVVL